jgi:hypothetical protein
MTRLALCLSHDGTKAIVRVDVDATIPREVTHGDRPHTVLMTMALTAANQWFAHRWCMAVGR